MALDDIGADSVAGRILKRALQQGSLAPAYLFYGPVGSDLEMVAMAFAKAVYCESLSDDFCDSCSICKRIQLGHFADLLWIRPEGQLIKIEVVREQLIEPTMAAPYESSRRIIIVSQAEYLTPQAANALLKTLEEPPPRVHIFLLSHHREKLLPTILSRCQQIPVGILGVERVAALLQSRHDLEERQALQIARMSGGRLAAAEAIALSEPAQARELGLAALRYLAAGQLPELLAMCEKKGVGDREQAFYLLTALERYLHDALVYASSADPALVYHDDAQTASILAELYGCVDAAVVASMLEKVWDAMYALRGYANAGAIMAELFYSCCALTASGAQR